jgi:Protein of unknown function (DUF3145)
MAEADADRRPPVLVPAIAVRQNMTRSAGTWRAATTHLRVPRPLGKTSLVDWQGGQVSVRGVLQVHSAPPALSPHVEWAVAGVLGVALTLPWVDQPASPGTLRGELAWQGRPGSSGALTSALAGWNLLRFEVTEEASPGCDAVRYSYTPSLGTFSAVISANGDVLVPEGRLRAAMTLAASAAQRGASRLTVAGAEADDGIGELRDMHDPRHPALGGSLEAELALLLGQPWDDELEPFRHAAAGAPVRWLHATG